MNQAAAPGNPNPTVNLLPQPEFTPWFQKTRWEEELAPVTGCKLSLTKIMPEGYGGVDGVTKGWVTWGVVGNTVVNNITDPFTLSAGLKVWVRVTTNGTLPFRVLTATIDTGTGSVPNDSGGSATDPPSTIYYLLGQVLGAGTVESPFTVSSTGCGSLRVSLTAYGYICVLASSGNPSATPPEPASPGGVKTSYMMRWDRTS